MNLKECMNNNKDDDYPVIGIVVILFYIKIVLILD